jgi:hypothetical protein
LILIKEFDLAEEGRQEENTINLSLGCLPAEAECKLICIETFPSGAPPGVPNAVEDPLNCSVHALSKVYPKSRALLRTRFEFQ